MTDGWQHSPVGPLAGRPPPSSSSTSDPTGGAFGGATLQAAKLDVPQSYVYQSHPPRPASYPPPPSGRGSHARYSPPTRPPAPLYTGVPMVRPPSSYAQRPVFPDHWNPTYPSQQATRLSTPRAYPNGPHARPAFFSSTSSSDMYQTPLSRVQPPEIAHETAPRLPYGFTGPSPIRREQPRDMPEPPPFTPQVATHMQIDEVQTTPPTVASSRRVSTMSGSTELSNGAATEGWGSTGPSTVAPETLSAESSVKPEPLEHEPPEDIVELDDHRRRKRNRTVRSCVPCHNHKRRCDRGRPCGRCTALGLTSNCVYEIGQAPDPSDTSSEVERMRTRLAELEQVVQQYRQKSSRPVVTDPASGRKAILDRQTNYKYGAGAPNPAAFQDMSADRQQEREAAVRDPGDGKPLNLPKNEKHYMSDHYEGDIGPSEMFHADKTGATIYIGAPAGKTMLRQMASNLNDTSEALGASEDAAFRGWLPKNTYPFSTIWDNSQFPADWLGTLPDREASEVLLAAFLDEIASFFQAWHLPTLVAEYREFMAATPEQRMTYPFGQIAVYAMMLSLGTMVRASIYEIFGDPDRAEAQAAQDRGEPKRDFSQDFSCSRMQSEIHLSAAFQLMRLASYMSSPTIEIMQTECMLTIYFLNAERAADGWSFLGLIMHQAVAMGLHIDPVHENPDVSERDAEIRRRIWWTIVGLDCLFCVSFGRPSIVTFYTTHLPADRTDDELSTERGSAKARPAPSNVLSRRVTEETYHAAYFQLSIPSLELLKRTFHIERVYERDAKYGIFTPVSRNEEQQDNRYRDALELGNDIFRWYGEVPEAMRFRPDDDTPESLLAARNPQQINQTLALCVKTYMLVLILHRPYMRADPDAYPESSALCQRAAHGLLRAYTAMAETGASIIWSWWTMSYRAYHAGTVCAFMALREPQSALAAQCLDDLRGAIKVFKDRITDWVASHPCQADLCYGLVRLERLVRAGLQQARDPTFVSQDPPTPRELMRAFPPPSPQDTAHESFFSIPQNELPGMLGDGFNSLESVQLPDVWAAMFGVKLDHEGNELLEDATEALGGNPGRGPLARPATSGGGPVRPTRPGELNTIPE